MTIIHMEVEAVDSTLRQMRSGLHEFEESLQTLQRARRLLDHAWEGGTATEFLLQLDSKLEKLTLFHAELERLEQRLCAEQAEWMEVAAAFGEVAVASAASHGITAPQTVQGVREKICGALSGDAHLRCDTIWSNPPTNAEQLAYMVMSLPPALPIVILQIGPGEYLVLMRGTTSGEEEGSNWGSAAEAMFGGSSYQNSVVKALQDAGLPADAKLHFAGHSQGGMIAQNLAVDPRVTNHFDVKSVTMFGSPDTLAKANSDVKYVSFEAPGDIVPKLDDAVVSMLPGQEWNPMAGHFRDVTRQGENHMIVNSPDAWNLDPNVSHSVYDNEGVLSGYKVPFEAKDWQNVGMSGSDVSTVGPKIYGGAKATVDFIGRRLKDMKVF